VSHCAADRQYVQACSWPADATLQFVPLSRSLLRPSTLVLLRLLLQNEIYLPGQRDCLLYIYFSRIHHPLFLSFISTTHARTHSSASPLSFYPLTGHLPPIPPSLPHRRRLAGLPVSVAVTAELELAVVAPARRAVAADGVDQGIRGDPYEDTVDPWRVNGFGARWWRRSTVGARRGGGGSKAARRRCWTCRVGPPSPAPSSFGAAR
jgi:hypothetical protein